MYISKKYILALTLVSLSVLFTAYLVWKKSNAIHIHSAEEQRKINAENNSDSVEFIYTEKEQREMQKWKRENKSMDDLVNDSLHGDSAALYLLGEYFFYGINLPLNVHQANSFFARSASLGFAPALNNIADKYINDKSHGLLGLVYKNLTISFGHTEFIRYYHNVRSETIKKDGECGQRLIDEIERISWQKYSKILKNQKYAQEMQNSKQLCLIGVLDKDITHEDYQYDNDYWVDVYTGDNEVFNLSEIKEKDMTYFEKLYYLYQDAIKSDEKNLEVIATKILETVNMMPKDEYSTAEIELLKRRAISQAKKVYKYVQKIENDANEAKKLRVTE